MKHIAYDEIASTLGYSLYCEVETPTEESMSGDSGLLLSKEDFESFIDALQAAKTSIENQCQFGDFAEWQRVDALQKTFKDKRW